MAFKPHFNALLNPKVEQNRHPVRKKTYTFRFGDYILILSGCILLACNDRLDIKQDYAFGIKTLPVPKKLKQGEVTALEFTIVREGIYNNAAYSFRYFQSEGNGVLTNGSGKVFPMNRLHLIASNEFALFYQSICEESQQLDFVFVDNFGQEVEYSITFQNDSKKD